MSYQRNTHTAAPAADEEALISALPSFLAPLEADDDFDVEDYSDAAPGFEPLVLPLHPGDALSAHWMVASDGRLVSTWDKTSALDS
jgi:hypothetical protein